MSQNTTHENKSLSIQQILSDAKTFCIENQLSILSSLKYPVLGILLLSLIATKGFGYLSIPLVILETYFYLTLAVWCHRLFLQNESPDSINEALMWDNRNKTFMLTSITLILGLVIIFSPIILLASSVGNFIVSQDNSFKFAFYITAIPFGYIFSRLSLVFPAIIIDGKNDYQRAWFVSKGNGWNLFLLISAIPLTTIFLIDVINIEHILFRLVAASLGVFVLMFEVKILSGTYNKLVSYNVG